MEVKIEKSWKERLREDFEMPYFTDLSQYIKTEFSKYSIFPPGKFIFNAFDRCPFDAVKVVILGQDPYHDEGQAHGLCFSVPDSVSFPPS